MGSQPEQGMNGEVDISSKSQICIGIYPGRCQILIAFFPDLGFTPVIKVDGPWTVEKTIEKLPTGAPAEGSSTPLQFFHMLERLKTTKREGWRRFGITR